MYVIDKPIFHPRLESGKSIIVKREHMEQHALIVENLEEQLRIAVVNDVMNEEDDIIKDVKILEIDVGEVKEGTVQLWLYEKEQHILKINELYKLFKEMSELLCDQEHMMANQQNITDQDDIDSRHQARMSEVLTLLKSGK